MQESKIKNKSSSLVRVSGILLMFIATTMVSLTAWLFFSHTKAVIDGNNGVQDAVFNATSTSGEQGLSLEEKMKILNSLSTSSDDGIGVETTTSDDAESSEPTSEEMLQKKQILDSLDTGSDGMTQEEKEAILSGLGS